MSDLPDIIGTTVINSGQDAYWQPLPDNISLLPKCDTLVLTLPFAEGSAEDVQLQKMMQACKLQREQYNIVHLGNGQNYSWHQLRDALQPAYVLLLGIVPQQLGIQAIFHLYAPNKFNEVTWVAAPSLPILEQQPDAKRQLWTSGLKPVFVDNHTAG